MPFGNFWPTLYYRPIHVSHHSILLLLVCICWQPLDVELHYTQGRTYGLKAQVGVIGGGGRGFFLALWPGSIRIRSTGEIFGFPRLVYSPRYSRGGWRGCRLPSSSPYSECITLWLCSNVHPCNIMGFNLKFVSLALYVIPFNVVRLP